MDDSRLIGEADVAVQGDGCGTAAGDGVKVVERLSAAKRKRGRPPKNQAGIMPSSPKRSKNDEEDVCFICFDGGSLVLCDRRGCPKAYHPACIKRDEAFFKSKAKWSCGWHICRTCQKASYYMCYTCTYSLCKNCSKDADYVNVRGNKGFCGTCMRTVMLIENSTLGNKEMVQVDFDDKTSWEYLFKVYWITLKEKLSLSLDELSKAKGPWKEIASLGPKGELSSEPNSHINAKRANMEKSFEDLGASTSKRRKTMEQENLVESPEAERMGVANRMPQSVNWGTKELLEFVAHMKNGDTSVISRFDVQALLLEYISRSNLRDPCQKSYIVCDSKLIKLFGKPKVGHFEMFKLLDAHFITNDQSRHIDTVRRGTIATQLAVVGNSGQPIIADDKMCKTSKKVDGQPITVDRNIEGLVKVDDVLSDIGSRETSIPPQLLHNSCAPTKGVMTASDDGCRNGDGDVRESGDLSEDQMENKSIKGSSKSMQNDTSGHNCGDNESVKSKELGSQSSPCSASIDIVNSNGVQMGSHLPHCNSVKDDIYFPGQPQGSSSLKSSTVSLKPCETQSHLVTDGHGVERWDSGSMDVNEGLNKTSEGQIIAQNVKQDNDRKSGKPCEQSWRSSPLKDASNGWDLHSGIISLDRALEVSEQNQDIDFSILTTSTSKLSNEDSKHQTTKNKQSLSLNVPQQDSGPSWSTVVITGSQLPEVAGEWGSYTSTPAKPSAEEWCSNLAPESSLKPTDLGSNHSAIPTSGNGQLTHSSSTYPANNATGWECSLADESVSDLLAEVEAMESLNGLPSPTSNLRSDLVLAQGSEHNCFSPVGGLSPAHDPGTGDTSSSRNNLQMPSHSIMINGLFGVSQSEVIDAHTSSSWHSSTTPEIDVDTRPSDISVNKYEAVPDIQQPTASSVTTWDMAAMTAWRPGPETTNINLGMGSVQGNVKFHWDGVGQGITNVSRGTAQETFQNSSTSAGNPHYLGSQERYIDPRDRGFEGRDLSFSRGRYFANRHSSDDGPNGVGSFRTLPKGKRVCKFYERGHCKKGASCSYWHP